ncbi:hypothetical protein KL943_004000 [Ogataea angusta]|nr:hypothetical protein KL943_004000 [Ogataea angusta]
MPRCHRIGYIKQALRIVVFLAEVSKDQQLAGYHTEYIFSVFQTTFEGIVDRSVKHSGGVGAAQQQSRLILGI